MSTLFDRSLARTPAEFAEFFGSILEASTESSLIGIDREGRILNWNEGARRLYGYEAEEAIGRTTDMLHAPEDVAAGRPDEMMRAAVETGKWEGTLKRVRKDGARFTARVVVTPRRDGDRNPTGFLLTSSDITAELAERRRAETLSREANVQLEAANLAKDRFLASMSHELRTPLNAILGFSGTMLMGLSGPLTDDQRKQLGTVNANGKHLLSIINDLLDLAKIESGNVELKLEPVGCRGLLEEVISSLRPLADAKGLQLELEAPDEELRIRSDSRALSQILLNLGNNAIKFTDAGEVLFRLERDERDGRPVARFGVADSGIGIRPEERVKLFKAFEQIEPFATRRYEGTGLGLYISQKLAVLLNGRISLESSDGGGSVFTLELGE